MAFEISKLYFSRKKKPIYCNAISPCGKFFGIGTADHLIRITQISILYEKSDKKAQNFSILRKHSGSVNAIEWSNKNSFRIASASDDKSIIIWKKNTDKIDNDNWSSKVIFLGHNSDVQDLSWSPDDQYLVSCSVDNTVMIWSMKSKNCHKKLKGHDNWVLGCCWNRKGNFIATQCKNGVVLLWDTKTWKKKELKSHLEKTSLLNLIDSGKKVDSIGDAAFARMSFTPNGEFLGISRGFDNVYTSSIIDISKKKQIVSLVGHSDSIRVIKFSPFLFKSLIDYKTICLCAVGSADKKISIWRSDKEKPILILENLFQSAILDISWHPNGIALIVCSLEGTFVLIDLKKTLKDKIEKTKNSNQKIAFSSINETDSNYSVTESDSERVKTGRNNDKIDKIKGDISVNKTDQKTVNFGQRTKKVIDYFNWKIHKVKTVFKLKQLHKMVITRREKRTKTGKITLTISLTQKNTKIETIKSNEKSTWSIPFKISGLSADDSSMVMFSGDRFVVYTFRGHIIMPLVSLKSDIVCAKLVKDILLVIEIDKTVHLWKRGCNGFGSFKHLFDVFIPKHVVLEEIINIDLFENHKNGISPKIIIKNGEEIVYCRRLKGWVNSYDDLLILGQESFEFKNKRQSLLSLGNDELNRTMGQKYKRHLKRYGEILLDESDIL